MNLPPHAYNPSLIRHQGRFLVSYRVHDRQDWRTSLYISELGDDLRGSNAQRIEIPGSLAENSHEDGRLFEHNGELWLSWTCSQYPTTQFRCVIVFGRLVFAEDRWQIERFAIPTYGKNDWTALEKNWVAFNVNGSLWSYYDTKEAVQTFIRLDGDKVVESVKSKSLEWRWGPIHGGAICRAENGNLLHFFNSRLGNLAAGTHRYHVGVAELSPHPPFDMLRISSRPILHGEEGYCLDGHRWHKSNVVFACGAVRQAGEILLSYGWNDSKCRVVRLTQNDLHL